MGILDTLTALAPILSGMAASRAKNQDTNTALGTTQASMRPNIVRQNLINSRKASDFGKGYTDPKLNWGGPGSVAKGQQAFYSGGPAASSPDTSELETLVQRDALDQAKKNYGIADPAASSGVDKAIGVGSDITGILGALSKLKGGSAPAVAGGPASPGTFGTGSTRAGILDRLKTFLGGSPGTSGADTSGNGFGNTDQFWGWGGNPGRPLGGMFPVIPEDPRHD